MSVGTLWVVSTPIGNLEDVSLRSIRILKQVSLIACEDTRVTQKLLARYEIHTKIISCHEHNQRSRSAELAARLEAGDDLAFVTDAGTPLVSDPGEGLIAAAIAIGAAVVAVPGPSAMLAALVACGLPTDRFTFLGFPPARGRERKDFLDQVVASQFTSVVYESPHRIAKTLSELQALAPERPASLHRELTKVHEEVVRGDIASLATVIAANPARGEYTLVVAGCPAPVLSGSLDAGLVRARELMAAGVSPSAAARTAAGETGVVRREIYRALVDDLGGE